MLEIDAPNVVLSVFKQHENGTGMIVRGYETAGVATSTSLCLPLMEQEMRVEFAPYEIKSFALNTETWTLTPVNLLEEAQ